jgi:hypothetical protein
MLASSNAAGIDESGTTVRDLKLTRELEAFAAMWDRNLGAQGFLTAFQRQSVRPGLKERR